MEEKETVLATVDDADVELSAEVDVVESDDEAVKAEEVEDEGDSSAPVEDNDKEKTDAFQGRIDKLTKSFRDSEREADEERAKNVELQKQLDAIPKPQDPLKTLEDFEYDQDKYLTYRADRTDKLAVEAAERVARSNAGKADADRSEDKFTARAKEFAKDHADYEEKVKDPSLRISQAMATEMHDSDIGPELAYHLASNPDIASDIARLSERGAIREMTLLEGKLRVEMAKESKKVSDAPSPPKKIAGRDAAVRVSTTDPKSDKMSDEEWFKAEDLRTAKMRG